MSLFVALESTVISHGLPYPQNIKVAQELESIVEAAGCTPKTIGIIGGQIRAGLSASEIEHLATASDVKKVSLRDLPIITAKGYDGATTVATTMWIATPAWDTGFCDRGYWRCSSRPCCRKRQYGCKRRYAGPGRNPDDRCLCRAKINS